jgi:hypothetical protein
MKSNEHDPLPVAPSLPEPGARASSRANLHGSLAPHELVPEEDPFAPGSPERRARLQRYVKLTVAACALLCVAAIVRVGIARVDAASEREREESAASVAHAPPPAVPTPPPSESAAAITTPSAATSSTPGTVSTASAVDDRELARRSLERGKTRDALAAAERAVAADPTDAEAWLLVGSANQELGHAAAARAAFRSCLKSAKHGPVRECRAMLH